VISINKEVKGEKHIELPCPHPIYPATGWIPLLPRMDWSDVQGAFTYQLQISRFPDFKEVLLDIQVTKSEFQLIIPLPILTLLFWRVRATDDSQYGPYCLVSSFTTGIGD
jgi:hypothetical protein